MNSDAITALAALVGGLAGGVIQTVVSYMGNSLKKQKNEIIAITSQYRLMIELEDEYIKEVSALRAELNALTNDSGKKKPSEKELQIKKEIRQRVNEKNSDLRIHNMANIAARLEEKL